MHQNLVRMFKILILTWMRAKLVVSRVVVEVIDVCTKIQYTQLFFFASAARAPRGKVE